MDAVNDILVFGASYFQNTSSTNILLCVTNILVYCSYFSDISTATLSLELCVHHQPNPTDIITFDYNPANLLDKKRCATLASTTNRTTRSTAYTSCQHLSMTFRPSLTVVHPTIDPSSHINSPRPLRIVFGSKQPRSILPPWTSGVGTPCH